MNELPTTAETGAHETSSTLELDLSGRQLGDYRLLRRLGRGAMADVYLAEQGSLRRQIAFKALKKELAADETYVRRFHMEAQAAAALVQANIVQIYEVGCIDGWHYIAQEYVEGQNLAQLIARQGTPDMRLALAVIRQVTAALCKAAERGIVHRDIKPENIMLARSGEVKVADFGLARVSANDDAVKLTQVGITMGTPLYMSPEQVEGQSLDPRSDIYSLGVTCYHMLAGNPPFRGDTALSVALQHVRTQPERLENLRPDLPAALCRIIHRMLAKDPQERYQSPRDLLRELRTLQIEGVEWQWPAELDELNAVETAALGDPRWQATQRLQTLMKTQARIERKRRWWRWPVAAGVAALVLGVCAAWMFREPFLLDVPTAALPSAPRMATGKAQYEYARLMHTEADLKSVEKEFPDDKRYVALSKMELAKLYLLENEIDRAKKLFDELATNYPEVETQYRAFGLAGQAIVESLQRRPQESAKRLAELDSLLGGLNSPAARQNLDQQMVQLINQIVQRNTEVFGQETEAKLKNLLDAYLTDETP